MYIEKLIAEPKKNRAVFWVSKDRQDEEWPTDVEIRKVCTDTYPCEILAYSVDTWGSQDIIRIVYVETE
jgi:hypothetical protein